MPTVTDFFYTVTLGVIAGVASGLILTMFFWLRDQRRERREKGDQVKYLSELIVKFRKRVFETTEMLTFKDRGDGVSADYVRKLHFDNFATELKSILSGRSSRLTFEETQEVKDIFLELHTVDTDFIPDKHWYREKFEKAASISWLRVTPKS